MLKAVRQVALKRLFGAGGAGFFASAAVGWLIDKVREADEPQKIDTSKLIAGETYILTTRPAMSRQEQKTVGQYNKAKAALDASRRPNRTVKKTAKALSKAQRKAGRAVEGSTKEHKQLAKAQLFGERFDTLTTPTPKELKLERSVAELRRQVDLHELAAMSRTPKRKRPAQTKRFT